MREVKVVKQGGSITLYVGKVDADGKYEVIQLTTAEAAIVSVKLQEAI